MISLYVNQVCLINMVSFSSLILNTYFLSSSVYGTWMRPRKQGPITPGEEAIEGLVEASFDDVENCASRAIALVRQELDERPRQIRVCAALSFGKALPAALVDVIIHEQCSVFIAHWYTLINNVANQLHIQSLHLLKVCFSIFPVCILFSRIPIVAFLRCAVTRQGVGCK